MLVLICKYDKPCNCKMVCGGEYICMEPAQDCLSGEWNDLDIDGMALVPAEE